MVNTSQLHMINAEEKSASVWLLELTYLLIHRPKAEGEDKSETETETEDNKQRSCILMKRGR